MEWEWISVWSFIACASTQHANDRKITAPSIRATVGLIQYIHCIVVAYSAANEAQNRQLMISQNILHWIQAELIYRCQASVLLSVSFEYRALDKMIFPFGWRHQFHIFSSDLMKFNLALGAFHLFFIERSQCSYPNRATASFSCCKEFHYWARAPRLLTPWWFRYFRKSGFRAWICSAAIVRH